MLRMLVSGCLALAFSASPAFSQVGVDENFDVGALDWGLWCPCQIDTQDAPVTFGTDPQSGTTFARIVADEAALGGNVCRMESPDFECRPPRHIAAFELFSLEDFLGEDPDLLEPLGPSLLALKGEGAVRALRKNPYCTTDVVRRVKDAGKEDRCIQRQELRLQKRYRHDATRPMIYAFRFRMPAVIEDRENSVRWVTAQWKHAPISERYCEELDCEKSWGPSPFLAQRFDNGVLRVTVQDEHCRCTVASGLRENLVSPEGRPLDCRSTHPKTEGNICRPSLKLEHGPDPMLASPMGAWVEMEYLVETGWYGGAVIEVRQDGRRVVRVTGRIGYEPDWGESNETKFKIGHYRDYMPYRHAMDIDWVRIRPPSGR